MCCTCPSEYPGQPGDRTCPLHGHQQPVPPHECNVKAHDTRGLRDGTGWRCPTCGTGWTFVVKTKETHALGWRQAIPYSRRWVRDEPGAQ